MSYSLFTMLRRSPAWRLTITLSAGLLLALAALFIAAEQPRFGIDFSVAGDRVMAHTVAPRGSGPMEVVAVVAPGHAAEKIGPDALVEEPNFLPDYPAIRAFFAQQARIADMLADKPELVVRDGGNERRIALQPSGQFTLPFPFWYQLFVGIVIYGISVWIWAIAPGSRANLLFAISGFAMLIAAATAAVYSTRELALGSPTFRILGIINEAGASLFGIAMSHLFLIYPRRLLPGWGVWLLWGVLGTWTVMGMARLTISPAFGSNGITVFEMALIIVAVAMQFFATRGDPVGRSALRWLAIGTLFGAGGFIATTTLPLALGRSAVVDQGMAFGFFLLIVIGIAIGLRRDKLFAVDRLSYAVLFYSSIAAVFIFTDAALIYFIGSVRIAGVATATALLPLLYLPLRDRAIAWIGGSRQPDTLQVLEDVARMSFARDGQERARLWRDSLDHAFQPLAIEPGDGGAHLAVTDHGAAMTIPAVAGSPPLLLRLARRGRTLFGQPDRALAERMLAIAARADAERAAYERGVDEERARVARDLHDDLAARLMDGLARDRVDTLRETIREALAHVRSIVNGPRGIATELVDALADARVEAAERLEIAGIVLDWVPAALPGTLNPTQSRALESAVREAITNIARHSGASRVTVSGNMADGMLALTIRDNGTKAAQDELIAGNGLRNMAYRMRSAGGSAAFIGGAEGFAVTITLPVETP